MAILGYLLVVRGVLFYWDGKVEGYFISIVILPGVNVHASRLLIICSLRWFFPSRPYLIFPRDLLCIHVGYPIP